MRLRDSLLGQFFLGAIVISIVVAFALTGTGASRGGLPGMSEECALWVGQECVDPKEYTAAFGLVMAVGLNDKAVKQLDLKREVARGLAERQVLLDEAKRLGLGTSEKAIDAELLEGRTRVSLPAKNRQELARNLGLCVDGDYGCAPGTLGLRALPVTAKGAFDYQLYERVVRRTTGRSPGHFKEMQEREYTAERVRELLTSAVRVSPEEAYLTMERSQSKVIARKLETKSPWFLRYFVAPTAEAVNTYAAAHTAEVDAALASEKPRYVAGCPVVRELFLSSGGERSDADSEALLKKLLPNLSRPDHGEKTIRELSEGSSAALGGRLGCLDASYGPGAEDLLKAVESLKKPGDVTGVVRTARGFHALVLEARVGEADGEAVAKAEAAYRLTAEAEATSLARAFTLAVVARVGKGASLEEALEAELESSLGKLDKPLATAARASDDRPKTDVTAPFTIEQDPLSSPAVGASPASLVFAMKEPGEITQEPIALTDGFALLQLKEKDLFTREKFEKEKSNILAAMTRQKADQLLAEHVDKLIEAKGGVRYDNRYAPTTRESTTAPKTPSAKLN